MNSTAAINSTGVPDPARPPLSRALGALASLLCAALCAALIVSPALAQESRTPETPRGVPDALLNRVAVTAVITGFPDGAWSGDIALARYRLLQATMRLLDALGEDLAADRPGAAANATATGALARLVGVNPADLEPLTSEFGAREPTFATLRAAVAADASAISTDSTTSVRALQRRIGDLNDQVAALEVELAALQSEIGGVSGGLGALPGEASPSGSRASRSVPAFTAPAAGEVESAAPEAARPAALESVAPPSVATGDARSPRFAGLGTEASRAVDAPMRFAFGGDAIVGPFGAQLVIDYGAQGRDAPAGSTLAAAAHVTFNAELFGFLPYAGVGGGYRFDLLDAERSGGGFADGLIGLEVPLGGSFGFYLESDFGYDFDAAEDDPANGFRPQLGLGVRLRF